MWFPCRIFFLFLFYLESNMKLKLFQDVSGKKKGEKKGQRSKKANKSKGSARKNNRKTSLPQGTNDLTAKLYSHMEKHKEVFT